MGNLKNKSRLEVKVNRLPAIFGLLIAASFFFSTEASGQKGTIAGFVTDASTNHPLSSVSVTVKELDITVPTDQDGRFNLIRIPAGSHILEFYKPGYKMVDIAVTVHPGLTTTQPAQLEFEFDRGDRIFLLNRKKAWAQALAGKTNSGSFSHVITSADMQHAGDFNLQRGLSRAPGIQTGRQGELNIRGAGRQSYTVSVNGIRMASTSPTHRSTDLGSITAEMAHAVHIVKVLTPDMDAEGYGGAVRIDAMSPVGNRDIQIRANGLANPRYTHYTGVGNLASAHYSERIRDDFYLAADLSYQNDSRGYESLDINFGNILLNDERLDVIEQISPGLNFETRNRFGGRLHMGYQPNAHATYFIQGLLITDSFHMERHTNLSSSNGDWIDQTTTGNLGSRGHFTYNPLLVKNFNNSFLVQTGGRHLFPLLNVEYQAGWSHGNIKRHHHSLFFSSTAGLNFAVDMSDRNRPQMAITNIRLLEDGTIDQRTMNFDVTERIRDEHVEDRYTARLDVEVPLRPVSIRAGTSGSLNKRQRSYEDADLSTLRRYNLLRFNKLPRSMFDVLDRYFFPDLLNLEDAAKFVETTRPEMRLNENDMFQRSLIWNYGVDEYVYSGYGMATLDLNWMRVTGGMRLEHTSATYDGVRVVYNRFNLFDSSTNSSQSVSYTNLFPHAQLGFSPSEYSTVTAAFSRSFLRHDYHLLAPFEFMTAADTTRFKGNPELKPAISDNFDLMIEHSLGGSGAIVIGLFYKDVSNSHVFIQEKKVTESEFPDLAVPEGETIAITERSYKNSDNKTTLYGFEVSWRHYLSFLPGFFSDLGVLVNYAWTQSEVENVRNGKDIALLYQSPHVVNTALDYNKGRFSGQVAWHWTAPALYQVASDVQWAPSVNSNEEIYLDLYEDGWRNLSASFGFRLSDRFRFWANASNIVAKERIRYGEDRDIYPLHTDLKNGIRMTAGLHFTL